MVNSTDSDEMIPRNCSPQGLLGLNFLSQPVDAKAPHPFMAFLLKRREDDSFVCASEDYISSKSSSPILFLQIFSLRKTNPTGKPTTSKTDETEEQDYLSSSKCCCKHPVAPLIPPPIILHLFVHQASK